MGIEKGLEVRVGDRLYVWEVTPRNLAKLSAITLFILIVIFNVNSFFVKASVGGVAEIPAATYREAFGVEGFYLTDTKKVDLTGLTVTGYSGNYVTTDNGNFPLLAVNGKDFKDGQLLYVELGDTADATYTSIYKSVVIDDLIQPGNVALINSQLQSEMYRDISVSVVNI